MVIKFSLITEKIIGQAFLQLTKINSHLSCVSCDLIGVYPQHLHLTKQNTHSIALKMIRKVFKNEYTHIYDAILCMQRSKLFTLLNWKVCHHIVLYKYVFGRGVNYKNVHKIRILSVWV